jgi:undecaprenyl phosphate N,N'-diacetylbacillosamine 1-phosphate transferase
MNSNNGFINTQFTNIFNNVIFFVSSRIYKRLMDLIFGFILLPFFCPLILIIAVLVVLESPGNPFFTQIRIGKNGKSFVIFKIRTLYREHFGIVVNEEQPSPYRITGIGKYLRITKLDELPQIINVLLGDMSLVGPRPDIPQQTCYYTPFQKQRLLVKPGLTGIAQISGNTLLTWPERIILDIWYIENWSFLLDLKIIFLSLISISKFEKMLLDPFDLHKHLPDKSKAISINNADN